MLRLIESPQITVQVYKYNALLIINKSIMYTKRNIFTFRYIEKVIAVPKPFAWHRHQPRFYVIVK